ncbi:thioesterase domain-containing protein [Fusobacteria bacterium ZRK30]|nr:thioesterase domain-containing protein [Fusobacteria bacterium ZRK30]
MDKVELQKYIIENIPIVKEMGFVIENIGNNEVVVSGEYKKHINHTNSVFGGSISSVMTLAGWGRVRILIEDIDNNAVILIKSNSTDFIKPVVEDYVVITEPLLEKDIAKLKKVYNKFGKGRIIVNAVLKHKNSCEVLAKFTGEFVAIKK